MPRRALVTILAPAIVVASLASQRPAHSAASRAADSVGVNPYMWFSPSSRTVHVALNASVGANNGGMNFNGNSRGAATITVPAGWKVRMHFTNLDAIPHSAIVITDQDPLPDLPQTPAFAGAYTRDLTGGLATSQTDDLNFTAGPAGKYILLCGVPGHGPSGMWVRFEVAADTNAPSYTM
jgi:sulfocyanin